MQKVLQYFLTVLLTTLIYTVKYSYIYGYFVAIFPYFNIEMWARASLFRQLWIQTSTEPVPLKYGELVTKYPRIYAYFYSVCLLSSSIANRTVELVSQPICKSRNQTV